MVIRCFFWTCLCPHSHSKPTIFSPRTNSRQPCAWQSVFCLWNFQRVSASSRVSGTTRFADNKNHAVAKPKLNQIAGINTPELSRASNSCTILSTNLPLQAKKCEKTLLKDMNLKYNCTHTYTTKIQHSATGKSV